MFSDAFIAELAGEVAKQVVAQMQESVAPKRLFTITEAGIYLGRTPKAVEHLIDRGAIKVTRLDGKRQIDHSALDKIIDDHTYFEV